LRCFVKPVRQKGFTHEQPDGCEQHRSRAAQCTRSVTAACIRSNRQNSTENRAARHAASKWLTAALSSAVNEGKLSPLNLSNAYKINFGLAVVVNAQGPLPKAQAYGSVNKSASRQGDRSVQTNWRELQQVAASNGYALTQLADGRLFAVPATRGDRDPGALLVQLASALKVKKEQLVWQNEFHTVGGLTVKGLAIEPRVFVR
jgi:hypothetical protein